MRAFVLLFLGSALLNLSFAFATRRDLPASKLEADEREYYDLAGEVVEGSYRFNPRRCIGYVCTLAALRSPFGERLFPVQLAVSLVFSLLAPCVYLLARRELGQQRAAWTAGLGVLVWPLFVRYSATLYSETLAAPVFAAFLLTLPGPTAARTASIGRWLVRVPCWACVCTSGRCICFTVPWRHWSPSGGRCAVFGSLPLPCSWRPGPCWWSCRGLPFSHLARAP